MHYTAILEWLIANNLLKAAVAFWVTLLLGALVTALCRPWKALRKRRRLQERIADSLDTRTPGGLTDLVDRLDRLDKALRAQDDEDDEGDDNGTDPHGGKVIPGRGPVIPDVHGGINGASHG